jgi:hypothetical protein
LLNAAEHLAEIRIFTCATTRQDIASAGRTKLPPVANSPRDSKRYNEAQVEAIMRAHIIDGHIVSEVWRMAERGELGVPAFKPDRRYMYQLIKNNRDAFEASNPEALAAATTKALAMAHKANLDALRNLGADTDPAERARLAKALAETARTLNTHTPKRETREPQRASENAPSDETPTSDRTLTNLLGLAPTTKRETRIKPPREAEPETTARGAKSGSLTRARTYAD